MNRKLILAFLEICSRFNVSPLQVLVEVYGVPVENAIDQEALDIGRKVMFMDEVSRRLTVEWIDKQLEFQNVDPSQPLFED